MSFSILFVCTGNICRSPLAERLLHARLSGALGERRGSFVVASAGTQGWEGSAMDPTAAAQLIRLGGDPTDFRGRQLTRELIAAADLVLTATADQQEYVVALRPDAAGRTFVLGEFGRLLPGVDPSTLPPGGSTPAAVYERGVAIVAAVDRLRDGAPPLPTDDLDDPWGRGDQTFIRIGDEISDTVHPLAALLLP